MIKSMKNLNYCNKNKVILLQKIKKYYLKLKKFKIQQKVFKKI